MTPGEFAALLGGRHVDLIIRCGHERGRRCRNARWLALDDGRIIENPDPCAHDVAIYEAVNGVAMRLRSDIADRVVEAAALRDRARRERRRFWPVEMIVRPRPKHQRRPPDEVMEEEWARFTESGERDDF